MLIFCFHLKSLLYTPLFSAWIKALFLYSFIPALFIFTAFPGYFLFPNIQTTNWLSSLFLSFTFISYQLGYALQHWQGKPWNGILLQCNASNLFPLLRNLDGVWVSVFSHNINYSFSHTSYESIFWQKWSGIILTHWICCFWQVFFAQI